MQWHAWHRCSRPARGRAEVDRGRVCGRRPARPAPIIPVMGPGCAVADASARGHAAPCGEAGARRRPWLQTRAETGAGCFVQRGQVARWLARARAAPCSELGWGQARAGRAHSRPIRPGARAKFSSLSFFFVIFFSLSFFFRFFLITF